MTPALAAYLRDADTSAEGQPGLGHGCDGCGCSCCSYLPTLVRLVRDAHAALDKARRESASDPDSRWARNATIILNEALARAERIVQEGG